MWKGSRDPPTCEIGFHWNTILIWETSAVRNQIHWCISPIIVCVSRLVGFVSPVELELNCFEQKQNICAFFTQNILPIHWKMWILYNIEILRAERKVIWYIYMLYGTNTPGGRFKDSYELINLTVGQRKKVTAVTFFPARPRLDQKAQIRAKYPKFPEMNSRDFWCIEWMWLDLSWVQIPGSQCAWFGRYDSLKF